MCYNVMVFAPWFYHNPISGSGRVTRAVRWNLETLTGSLLCSCLRVSLLFTFGFLFLESEGTGQISKGPLGTLRMLQLYTDIQCHVQNQW